MHPHPRRWLHYTWVRKRPYDAQMSSWTIAESQIIMVYRIHLTYEMMSPDALERGSAVKRQFPYKVRCWTHSAVTHQDIHAWMPPVWDVYKAAAAFVVKLPRDGMRQPAKGKRTAPHHTMPYCQVLSVSTANIGLVRLQ